MNKVVWLNNHGNCFPFNYGFCPSKKAYDRVIREMEVKDAPQYPTSQGCTIHFEDRAGEVIVLVTVGEDDLKQSPHAVLMLLVHEASHVFDLLCVSMGEKRPSEEFKAYTIQMFASQLTASYIRTRRPKLLNLLVRPT